MLKKISISVIFFLMLLSAFSTAGTVKTEARQVLAPHRLALYYDEHRVNTNPNDYQSAIVELTLGEAVTLQGVIEPPPLKSLSESELYYLIDEARNELGLSIGELSDIERWPYMLSDMVYVEGAKKLLRIGANYLPGAGGEAVSAGMVVYDGYKSVERGSGYADVASSAASLVAGHELDKLDKTALKYAKVPGYGQVVLGTYGAINEAMDTKQYEEFNRNSAEKFRLAAEFHILLNRKVRKALEDKNKGHYTGYIYFDNAECEVENRSLLGMNGIKVKYRLVGTLYQEAVSDQKPEDMSDMSGAYKGTLYLTVEGVDLANSLDAGWADRTNLCIGSAVGNESVGQWCQILKRFPDRNWKEVELDNFTETTISYASLVRKLSGEFTATVSSKDGIGKVSLSGALNNISDETTFNFHHSLYMHSRFEVVKNNGKNRYGQWESRTSIWSEPEECGLNGLYVKVSGNEALGHTGDAAYAEFGGYGRICLIPKTHAATVFDDLKYPPKMTIKPRE